MELTYDPAKAYPPNHCHNFWGRRMRALPIERVVEVVGFIRQTVHPTVLQQVRDAILKDREFWWVEFHFTWAMKFRNFLRENGFDEKALGLTDLDDYYGGFLELAVMGADWYDDVPHDA